MMDTLEIIRRARCCACRGPLGETVNLVSLRRRAEWQCPTAGNLRTGDGPSAVAVVCDSCVEGDAEILDVIEIRGEELVYHDVTTLEELPPEPTHILVSRGGFTGIECLVCGAVSWHPDDVAQLYCGNCKKLHPITP